MLVTHILYPLLALDKDKQWQKETYFQRSLQSTAVYLAASIETLWNISNIAMSQFQSKWKKQDNETIAQLEYTWLEGPLLTKERNLESKIQSNICLTLKACHFWGSTGAMALQYFGRSAKSISNGAGGAYMPTTILLALLDFQTFLPPCIEFNVNIFCH